MERKFINVILLGFGFMFVFTAFQTMGNIEVCIILFFLLYLSIMIVNFLKILPPKSFQLVCVTFQLEN